MQRLLLISVVASLAAATPAVAQDPIQDAYGGSGVLGEAGQTTGSGMPDATEPAPTTGSSTDNPLPPPAGGQQALPPTAATTTRGLVPRPLSPGPGQQLPFTGLDIALLVFGGAMLLALGFGLRRASGGMPV